MTPSSIPVIAVLDIGKTNKKIILYDNQLTHVDTSITQIEEESGQGICHVNAEAVSNWFLQELERFGHRYHIRAISISSHGATIACLDERGALALPVLAYTMDNK